MAARGQQPPNPGKTHRSGYAARLAAGEQLLAHTTSQAVLILENVDCDLDLLTDEQLSSIRTALHLDDDRPVSEIVRDLAGLRS